MADIVAAPPQPFYTSKTFWVLVITFLFNILNYFKVIPAEAATTVSIDSILAILGIIFRWQASGPLQGSSSK